MRTLRECQKQAFAALANYYGSGGGKAACVMSLGAGKTVLGVTAVLAFTGRRALVITPGNVIRGTFDRRLITRPSATRYTACRAETRRSRSCRAGSPGWSVPCPEQRDS